MQKGVLGTRFPPPVVSYPVSECLTLHKHVLRSQLLPGYQVGIGIVVIDLVNELQDIIYYSLRIETVPQVYIHEFQPMVHPSLML